MPHKISITTNMGNSESSVEEEGHFSDEHLAQSETLGYRVLGVQPNSPASSAGLVSFLDFLVGCEEQMLLSNDDDIPDVDFVQLLKDSVGRELELLVYNIKSQKTRLVHMTPQRDWGGKGLIGVTIRLDDYATADERLLRVLDVEPTSPADVAGLMPLSDYLLGTATVSFSSVRVLASILAQYEERPFEIYVYNTETDTVRMVTLLPTYEWGGSGATADGLLGAEVGMGYLHTFPVACRGTDGASMDMNVARMVAPRPRLSNDTEDEDPEEEEIIDLTFEDREDDGRQQCLPKIESSGVVKETEKSTITQEPHIAAEAEILHQLAPVSVTATATAQTQIISTTHTQDRQNAAHAPTATVTVDEPSPTNINNSSKNNNDSTVSTFAGASVAAAKEANVFRLSFPAMPFRSGTYTPPVSATSTGFSGAGSYFPPPPISNVDIGTTTTATGGKMKMPPPPMLSHNRQEMDLR